MLFLPVVILWKKNLPIENCEIVLINKLSLSKKKDINKLIDFSEKTLSPIEEAAEIFHQETSFYLDPKRIDYIGAIHSMDTLAAELTKEEIDWFKSQKDVHINSNTLVEVHSIKDFLSKEVEVDWNIMGRLFNLYYAAWNSLSDN